MIWGIRGFPFTLSISSCLRSSSNRVVLEVVVIVEGGGEGGFDSVSEKLLRLE